MRWNRLRDRIRGASELLRPAQVGHVEPERIDVNRLLGGRRDDLDRDDPLPLALAEEQAVEPPLLLSPAELPGGRGEPQQARHGWDDDVGPCDLEGIARAIVT